MMTCATFVAVGSFTARVPVNVASGSTGLIPVQPWQPAQAPSYTALPLGSMVAAMDSAAGVGCLLWLRQIVACNAGYRA